ncbi:hypothetical protein QVD17_06989 [Tagetes erecta]|uniref:Serine carboxypeptidase n=1 Tax=Tagetes erecta TaxID=13708 RepID=A0AAD8P717_TARER|nr:hypothetical protein QVD17_06989 [Tagetes erecta]
MWEEIHILERNDVGNESYINLKGYILGNPLTFQEVNNYKIRLLMALFHTCGGEYRSEYVRPTNIECLRNLELIMDTNMFTTGLMKTLFKKHCIFESGDHDMLIPHQLTQAWIKQLNYNVIEQWRSWKLNGQIAGYTESHSNMMTFTTVKAWNMDVLILNADKDSQLK